MSKLPKTEAELELIMIEQCYNFNSYSINGNSIDEGYGIDKSGGNYTWYYKERGQKHNIKSFRTEEEIITYAYEQIERDKWATAHCIGFTSNNLKSLELSDNLRSLGISYFQEQIPYYGPQAPVFRTFVFGCDIKKVKALKDKYYEMP